MKQFRCKNTHELKDIALKLIAQYPNERLFAFNGQMGAGKTTFIKAMCAQLGCTESVTSPTYAIVNEYLGTSGPIFHFDFYRLKNSDEAINIGYEEYIYSGNYCLMEWPQIIEDIIPFNVVKVLIEVEESTDIRIFTF